MIDSVGIFNFTYKFGCWIKLGMASSGQQLLSTKIVLTSFKIKDMMLKFIRGQSEISLSLLSDDHISSFYLC